MSTSLKKKRVLVTGGSGFIPSHIVHRLVDTGAHVLVTTKYNSIIDNVRLADVWDSIDVIEADLRNQDSIRLIRNAKPDVIIHTAAYNHVGDSFTHFSEALDSNLKGTANLIEGLKDFERFVYISTSEVYGFQKTVPFEELKTPFPTSPYAVGKYGGELYCRMKHHVTGLPIAVVRPFNAFGPYQSPRAVLAELIINCLRGVPVRTTEGKQTREFNYVDNLVDGILMAATNRKAVGEVINLGTGREIPIRDVVRKIHKLTNSSSRLEIGVLPYRPTEIWRMCASNRKARRILGWSPEVGFEEGLKKTIEWYRAFTNEFFNPKSGLNRLARQAG